MCKNTIKIIYGYACEDANLGRYEEICKRGWFDDVNSKVSKPLPDDYKLDKGDDIAYETMTNWLRDFEMNCNDTKASKYIHRNIGDFDDFIVGVVICKLEADCKIMSEQFTKTDSFPIDDIPISRLSFYISGGVCETCDLSICKQVDELISSDLISEPISPDFIDTVFVEN